MNDSPLVSVAIPTYNQPALLVETLGTVFSQTFQDFEVVILNDGSTDDTVEQLQRFEREHPDLVRGRMRIITQSNGGIGVARNRAIDESRGKYVALLDHDDIWLPRKLETQVGFMRKNPAWVGCTAPYAYSTAPEKSLLDVAALHDGDYVIRQPIKRLAEGHLLIMSSALMIDRERAKDLRYGTDRDSIEDQPFQIGLFARGPVGIAGDEILLIYRWHEMNYSRRASYHSHGVRALRAMTRAGRFSELDESGRRDLQDALSRWGRTAAVRELLDGSRWRAAGVYLRELPHQLRRRRWAFLGLFPPMLLAPRSLVRKGFSGAADKG
jgi:teichuronic acid biosynthesis glycosyltransferase TuaG